jgi:hypothetical protein
MADDSYFLPDDGAAADTNSAEQLATPQQWASMSFAPVPIDPNKFGSDWEQARGTIARAAIAVLRFDDRALTQHFMNQPEPLREAVNLHAELQRELDYMKTHVEALELAATRVLCAASRCAEQPQG